jgi:hypothetical protein
VESLLRGARLLTFIRQGRGRNTVETESPAAPIIVGPFGPVIAVLLPASGLVPSRGLRSEERGVVLAVVRHAPTLCLLCRRPR